MAEDQTIQKILIADDDPRNRRVLKEYCEEYGFKTYLAENGKELYNSALKYKPDIILTDVVMPEMTGFEATKKLRETAGTKHLPIIMITSLDSKEDMIKGISCGATDLLTKPFDKRELIERIRNNLRLKEYQDFLKKHNVILERLVAEKTKDIRKAHIDLKSAHEKIKTAYVETIFRLTLASEFKDEDTGDHIKRVSLFAQALAQELEMDKEFCDTIYHASPMHDLGKVGIPDHILLKPSGLSPDEWDVMKSHTTVGSQILKGSDSVYLQMAEEIALAHHERWNGTGYPQGLRQKEIPLPARIMNIVDQYDALRSKRPYKQGFTHEKTVDILKNGDGRTQPGHFDPQLLDAFLKIEGAFEKIYNESIGKI